MPSKSTVPPYLRHYCKDQDYARYTPREHATWRYILRQARDFFSKHAVPSYLEGIRRTGISIDAIPSIQHIDECLQEFGWRAVGVSGFIPPAAFLDFQARAIMPIAMDMRTLEHVAYTPAPDIVHEAAGHIPILIEPSYRNYISAYASAATKAIITEEDVRVYEAIRTLSDIKENPDTRPEEIAKAQETLNETIASMKKESSELTKVARMNWWTAEYGLMGDLKNPKIYGAGLLSSVGESRECLKPKVKKVPLTVDCTEQAYDITEPQPQLFVAESFEQLPEILEELDSTFSYRVGGSRGLDCALRARTVNTVVFENGFSASGILDTVMEDKGQLDFFKLSGPVQLSFESAQLPDQGRERHPSGFSSPMGKWKASGNPTEFSDADLERMGLRKNQRCRLEMASGFVIEGILTQWIRKNGKLGVLQWRDCKVTRASQTYFQPEWGEFDQLVGTTVVSVHGGPADRETFGDYRLGEFSTSPGRVSPFNESEKQVFKLYTALSTLRGKGKWSEQELKALASEIQTKSSTEWLLDLELLELGKTNPVAKVDPAWIRGIEMRLQSNAKALGPVVEELAKNGVQLSGVV